MIPLTVACQAPLSMGFSRQGHWSRLPFPPPGGLPNPGIEPAPLMSPELAGGFFPTVPPGRPTNPLDVTKTRPIQQFYFRDSILQKNWTYL